MKLPEKRKTLSTKEIAELYEVTAKTVHNWRAKGYVVSWEKAGAKLIKFQYPEAVEEINAFLKWREEMQHNSQLFHNSSRWGKPKPAIMPAHMQQDEWKHLQRYKGRYLYL